jgi:hypothetical protein
MNIQIFEQLLNKGECSTIDFKREMYSFEDSATYNKNMADVAFIKDILSMYNTRRETKSYILIGVDNTKNIVGINKIYDNAFLQNRIIDKVAPIPNFSFYIFDYKSTSIGIFEIEKPTSPMPSVPLKDIEVDKKLKIRKDELFFRRDSMNKTADNYERSDIYIWFRELDYSKLKKQTNEQKNPLFLLPFKEIINTKNENGKPIKNLIGGAIIKQKWENICNNLARYIRDIDRNTNWSNEDYTPLEAEVEIKTSTGTKKIIKDLLEAIKQSNDYLFLIIGEPGSGKSVALRKLCLDLLKNSLKTEYIPIYVNLKEWVGTENWHKSAPTPNDLQLFVKAGLFNSNPDLADFFYNYYEILNENGNLFFILDSFDEIPQILGSAADSKLIQDVTIACREFLIGSKNSSSRGIIASREYRMPNPQYLESTTILRIRPFSIEKIEQTLIQGAGIDKAMISHIFKKRKDLVMLLSNPFITSLFCRYIIDNKNTLPNNQSELFQNYVNKAIDKSIKELGFNFLSVQQVIKFSIAVAKEIFLNSTLQLPIKDIQEKIQNPHLIEIIEILKYAGIARGTQDSKHFFSLSHRRFYEYFIVQDMIESEELIIPLNDIPLDSLGRDTLIMYAEVAPLESARKIANYCWEIITNHDNIQNIESIHCLRFLIDAFIRRTEALSDFCTELSDFINSEIYEENDPIAVKLAVEALGILPVGALEEGTIRAFELNDSWLNETALRSCRHLDKISENLEYKIYHSINTMEQGDNMYGYSFYPQSRNIKMDMNELIFSLSLSEAFKDLKEIVEWEMIAKKIEEKRILMLVISILPGLPVVLLAVLNHELIKKEALPSAALIVTLFVVFMVSCLMGLYYQKIYPVRQMNKHFVDNKFIYKKTALFQFFKQTKGTFRLLMPICIVFLFFCWYHYSPSLNILQLLFFSFISTQALFVTICIGMILIIIPYMVFQKLKIHKKNQKIYNLIDKSKINQRVYIAEVFLSLSEKEIDKHLNKFITDLENDVKFVHGEFPEGFLKLGQSREKTRLIQLEEKWRNAERKKN